MNQRHIAKNITNSKSSTIGQLQNNAISSRLYKGSIDCGIQVSTAHIEIKKKTLFSKCFNKKKNRFNLQTVRNEGFSALYKGFIPTWFRMGPWNIIFFITYEQLKQFY